MLKYISLDEALEVHKLTIENSGGGLLGQLEIGKLDSVLSNIQNDEYYPTIQEKLTHLFFCTCQFHCFQDGNKRLALTLSTKFLLDNGYLKTAISFMRTCENISYHVAAGKISKNLLLEILTAVIDDTYENNEELKLKILNAINS